MNVPSKRLSSNLILGAVSLDPEKSQNVEKQRGLIEKTNREGFVENPLLSKTAFGTRPFGQGKQPRSLTLAA